jgi:hypothetical protein
MYLVAKQLKQSHARPCTALPYSTINKNNTAKEKVESKKKIKPKEECKRFMARYRM